MSRKSRKSAEQRWEQKGGRRKDWSLQIRGDGGEPACKGEGTEKLGRAKTEEMEKEQIY